ncbi:HesB-like protein [Clostridium sp. MT-14]|uniref:HesB-like protein n=1 Tax=Clostridium aromativorans TaxID=2836848 RepID=A0ABS8N4Y5_9CLOT|nr:MULTISPECIES: HesB-like protein [Clostridium]KAA8674363.1 HesB-like protein [Clostridium sp. HV4-5-A1G]MCC9294872.1 HesB-like protein [Clostridium aromativorans]CAB1250392.1 conserved hypothetical protein [Clostridiaceae bacterium BL-3]
MNFIKISNTAYNEFKKFLTENNITYSTIRIYLDGMSCHGPHFNMSADKKNDNDLTQQIKDINFIVDKNLFMQFSGFIFLCGSENGLGSFSIEPVFKPNLPDCENCNGCKN